MEEFLSFVTIDVWELIFTWGNLLILFLLMKKLLFKPVCNILAKREQEVNDMYENAHAAEAKANSMKSEYESRLSSAKNEAEQLLKNATRKAQLNEEEIIKDAHNKANLIKKRAEEDIALEKKNALNEVKNDLSDMAVDLASKIIGHDVDESKHREMIDSYIDSVGEVS